MDELTISLFDQFRVFLNEEELTTFRMQKVRALLAILAAESTTAHTRDKLMTLLWPGMLDQSARSNLRQALFHLRQAIPGLNRDNSHDASAAKSIIVANRQTIQLNPQVGIIIDIQQFKKLVKQSEEHNHLELLSCHICQQTLSDAVALYKGDFLADFYLDDSNEFEEWAEVTRQYYRRKALDALEILTTICTRKKSYLQARHYAERQLEIDEFRESAYRQMIQILALIGRRSEALSYYEGYRQLLAEELGMQPSKRTTDLYEKIQSGDLRFDISPEPAAKGYELKEEIGAGSYGIIHRAFQSTIGREVAIKIIRPRFSNDPAFIRRFEAEAQTIARLEHPHIVPLYDYWRDPAGAYLVMRLLRGGNLLDMLESGPWTPKRAAGLINQIAPALHTAHLHGVVHRDIKPANILFDESGNSYLSDFGIAKNLSADSGSSETLKGEIIGTPDYVSPEQLQNGPVSPQSDIYSLGAVLYEVLSGEKPFPDLPVVKVIENQLHNPLPLVNISMPDISDGIDAVIQKATAKDPDARYEDVLQMAQAFQQAVSVSTSLGETESSWKKSVAVQAINPYKGLRPFQEGDAADFYGREILINHLVQHLEQNRFLAVIGPSGSGKSSVVKAGLIPALRRGSIAGSENWYIAEMIPGTHPLEELELALWPIAVDPPPSLVEPMSRDSRGMLRTIRRILPDDNQTQLLLFIDQFEELFTLVDSQKRRDHFLSSLLQTIQSPHSPVRVVITMRADFYDRPLQIPPLAQLFEQHTQLVLPLNREELIWAIREPARQSGVNFDEGVVTAIVSDVFGQPGTLPMLQYALTKLFDGHENRRISLQSFNEIGGVLGVLAATADRIYDDLSPIEKTYTRHVFLRLVTQMDGVEDTRRRARQSELAELAFNQDKEAASAAISKVLDTFGTARLLTFDRDPLTREPTVEVAHEALIREWQQLRQWLDESREDIRIQRSLSAVTAEWQDSGGDPAFLLHGSRLQQFATWARESNFSLTQSEQAFIIASQDEQKRLDESEQERRQRELETAQQLLKTQELRAEEQEQASTRLRRRAYFLAGLLAVVFFLAIAAIIAGSQALINAASARRSADEFNSLALASGSRAALLDGSTDLALALSLAANEIEDPPAFARQTLYEAALAPGTIKLIDGGGEFRWDMGTSPDGRLVASAADNATISIYDVFTGEIELLLSGGHTEPIGGVTFTPDGQKLLSGGFDDLLIYWDLSNGEIIRRMESPFGDINQTDISQDGRFALAANQDGIVSIWDHQSGDLVAALEGHDPQLQIQGVAFSPDGKLAASGSEDTTVIIWDIASHKILHHLYGHDNVVFDVAFSPDGKTVASAGFDNIVILWDVETGEQISTLEGHKDFVFDVDFDSDGSRLLSSSRDQTVILWDVDTAQPIEVFKGEAGRIFTVAFLDDERAISTASTGNLRHWSLYNKQIKTRLPLTSDFMSSFAQSSDGEKAAFGIVENFRIVDLPSGETISSHQFPFEELAPLLTGEVSSLVFDQSGDRLLAGNDEGAIILWDLVKGDAISRFNGHILKDYALHSARILELVFSHDGRQFISTSDDKTLIVWDINTGEIIYRYSSPTDTMNVVVFSPDSQVLAGGSGTYRYLVEGDYEDNNIHLWNTANWEEENPLVGHEGPVTALTFSQDGRSLLSGSIDETVRLWDLNTGKQVRTFEGHTGGIFDVEFSPNGQYIASAGVDGSVIVWDIESGDLLRQLKGHSGLVYHTQFVDNDTLWTASEDGHAIQWDLALDQEKLIALAKENRTIPEFDCTQRRQYQIKPLCPSLEDNQVEE